jgi:flagellar basal-body rod modification protein FlgD
MQVNNIGMLPTGNNPSGTSQNELSGDSFMTLLVAQLQNQDPLQPMDPTQFVAQLVQFNQLEQTIEIRQILENNASAAATPAASDTKA